MFPPPGPPPAALLPGQPPLSIRQKVFKQTDKVLKKEQCKCLSGPLLGSYLLRMNSDQCCTTWTDVQNVKEDSDIKCKNCNQTECPHSANEFIVDAM